MNNDKNTRCNFCGTLNNAHHSAECIDTNAKGYEAPAPQPVPPSKSSDLLPCDQCGADPKKYCNIATWKGREPHEKNTAKAECLRCGYLVAIETPGALAAIRKLWNVRTR